MLSRRIDLTTELPLEDVERLESRVPDAFLATGTPGYLIPPSRITLKPPVPEARLEAERLRRRFVLIAFEPERRSEAIEAMRCPFIDAISFTLETARMIDKGLVHVARINSKAIELRLAGDLSGIKRLVRNRHRLTVRYAEIYFGSGAKKASERADPYAMNGFLRRLLRYDLLGLSAERQRRLFMRNHDRLSGYEIARGVRSIKNKPERRDGSHGGGTRQSG